nr:SAM-dependent methyltransferase [uncultured Rhodopila sp.]
MTESRSAAHFQKIYEASADPWGFGSDPYEQEKYGRTLATLGDRRFVAGLEVGCSIGVLTRLLAPRCDSLLGIDLVEQPLAAARARCSDQPQVRFERMQVPQAWPDGRFDLIVLSEVLYFLTAADIEWCARRVRGSVLPGGVVVLVNWLGESDDPTPGDEAADRFIRATAGWLGVLHQDRRPGYRLDVLERR